MLQMIFISTTVNLEKYEALKSHSLDFDDF